MERFLDRYDAGARLAKQLKSYNKMNQVIIVALPRGGVPVAFEVAQMLGVELDVLIVRKLGVPSHAELAFGAMAEDGTVHFNEDIVALTHLSPSKIQEIVAAETIELERRKWLYRPHKSPLLLTNRIVILVDDGIATGATMRAAIGAVNQQKPESIVVAVPVAAKATVEELSPLVDQFVCLKTPEDLYAVGIWYEDFLQTSDEEVAKLLEINDNSWLSQ